MNNDIRAGFRLDKVEVYNWGTFDGQIFSMVCDGQDSVLVGENGSGKSTLVDAIVTLLVPTHGRKYNSSSTEGRRSDRDEKSYVRGAYVGKYDETLQRGGSQHLRPVGSYSVLLAVFRNYQTGRVVSIAQVFRPGARGIDKDFFVADKVLSIAEHFPNLEGKWKEQLKAQGIEECRSFEAYRAEFRRFGLRNKLAIEAFNRAVSVKDINSIEQFVREVMFEPYLPEDDIDGLRTQFDSLMGIYDSIQRAKEQLKLLAPLMDHAIVYEERLGEMVDLEQAIVLVPDYVAYHAREALKTQIDHDEEQLQLREREANHFRTQHSEISETVRRLQNAKENDAVGNQIALLEKERALIEIRREHAHQEAQEYGRLVRALSYRAYSSVEAFTANIEDAAHRLEELPDQINAVQKDRETFSIRRYTFAENITRLHTELEDARSVSNRIPPELRDLQKALVNEAGATLEEMPFIGEVVRVLEDQEEWEPALQRLLRDYATNLLVPDKYFGTVSRYVNDHHLNLNLGLKRIVNPYPHSDARDHRQHVDWAYEKLEVKNDCPHKMWLYTSLRDEANFVCCNSIAELDKYVRGVTREGQVRYSHTNYRKDDAKHLKDRSEYFLGWDNLDRVHALEQQLDEALGELQQLAPIGTDLDNQLEVLESDQKALERLLEFQDFTLIDWRLHERRIAEMLEEEKTLRQSSDIEKLEQELAVAVQRAGIVQTDLEAAITQTGLLRENLGSYAERLMEAETRLQLLDINWLETEQRSITHLDEIVRAHNDLLNIAALADRFEAALVRKKSVLRDSIGRMETMMLPIIVEFKRKYEIDAADMPRDMRALEQLKTFYRIVSDDELPSQEAGFSRLLNDNLLTTLIDFRTKLESRPREMQRRIDQVNARLEDITYDAKDNTFVRIRYDDLTNNTEIAEFREDLRRAVMSKVSEEDIKGPLFLFVRDLVDQTRDEDWVERVLDTRRWQRYFVEEIYRATGQVKEAYMGSAGKSGGQTVKLAYTIMAAALVQQYEIVGGFSKDLFDYFCFAVIDEAFDKLHDENVIYTMELFRKLGLQLMVVTTETHIPKVERYMDAFHFVSAIDGRSYVRTITATEYQDRINGALN